MKKHFKVKLYHDEKTVENRQVKDWRIGHNLILLYNHYSSLGELNNDYDTFIAMPIEARIISDDESISLFGANNTDRYNKMRHEFFTRHKKELLVHRVSEKRVSDADIDPINLLVMMKESTSLSPNWYEGYLSKSKKLNGEKKTKYLLENKNFIQNAIESSVKEDNTFELDNEIFPIFKPDELSYMQYCEDYLDDGTSITDWQNTYSALIGGKGKITDYDQIKELWIHKINYLLGLLHKDPSNKTIISNILAWGWNPNIPFTQENINKASNRIKNYLKLITNKYIFYNLCKYDYFSKYDLSTLDTLNTTAYNNEYLKIAFVYDNSNNNLVKDVYISTSNNFREDTFRIIEPSHGGLLFHREGLPQSHNVLVIMIGVINYYQSISTCPGVKDYFIDEGYYDVDKDRFTLSNYALKLYINNLSTYLYQNSNPPIALYKVWDGDSTSVITESKDYIDNIYVAKAACAVNDYINRVKL